jgi:hypothetical protein
LGQLVSDRAVDTYERKLAVLTKADLLIIDDFGLKPMRPGQDEDFHDVITDRYDRRPTIITSNLDYSEWNDAFHNKLLGAATLDRIMHGAYQVVLDGKSYRTPHKDLFPLAEAIHKHVTKRGRLSEKSSTIKIQHYWMVKKRVPHTQRHPVISQNKDKYSNINSTKLCNTKTFQRLLF